MHFLYCNIKYHLDAALSLSSLYSLVFVLVLLCGLLVHSFVLFKVSINKVYFFKKKK